MRRAGVVIALLTACGGARARPATPPRPAPPAVPVGPTTVTVDAAPGRWGVVDERHFFLGGLRVELRDGRPASAEDGATTPLVGAAPTDGPWVFLAEDGLVAASEGFLGPLRPIGRVAPGARMPPSRGRAAVLQAGRLWVSDGRSLVAADVLGRRVVAAGFADARFGAAALADGALAMTRDGGARWEAVDLAGDIALTVTLRDDLRVDLLHRRVVLGRDGRLTDAAEAAEHELPRAAAEALTALQESRDAARGAVHLADGAWARVAEERLLTSDGRSEPLTRWLHAPGCRLTRWGPAAALDCRGGRYRLDPDGRTTALVAADGSLQFDDAEGDLVWSDDGRHAARRGPCPRATPPTPDGATGVEDEREGEGEREGEDTDDAPPDAPREAPPDALCVLDDGVRRWRQVALPDAGDPGVRWSLVGLHGARALLRNALDRTEYAVFGLDGAVTSPVRFEDPSVHVSSLRWAADGALHGLGERCGDGCASVVLLGSPERPLAARDAPGPVASVAFADARRGLAVAAEGASLWRTVDGGGRWEVIPVEGVGQLGERPTVSCDDDGCAVGAFVRLRGWGPPGRPSGRLLAAAGALATAPDFPAEEPAEPVEFPSLRCAVLGPPRASPWAPVGAAPEAREVWRGGVWALSAARPGAATAPATLRWWTPTARGAATLPGAAAAAQERPTYELLGGDRAALVLARGATTRLLWVDGRGARAVEGVPLLGSATLHAPESAGRWFVVPGGDGGALVLVTGSSYPYTFQVVAELGPDGAVRARRSFVPPPGPNASAAARHEGRWGWVSSSAAGTRFDPLAGGAPASLPPWRGPMAPCAATAAPGAITLHAPSGDSVTPRLQDLPYPRSALTVVELSPAGACVRSIAADLEGAVPDPTPAHALPDGRPRRSFASLRAVRAGVMEGFVDDGSRRAAVRCEAPRQGVGR